MNRSLRKRVGYLGVDRVRAVGTSTGVQFIESGFVCMTDFVLFWGRLGFGGSWHVGGKGTRRLHRATVFLADVTRKRCVI